MGMQMYRYQDDGGGSYQIMLDDTFATALGYQPPVESDGYAYIPAAISPRFVTYVSPGGLQFRDVVVTDPAIFVAPPNPITVEGTVWQIASANGESFMQLPGGNVRVISGPQGPAGQLAYLEDDMGSDTQLTPINTDKELARLSNIPAGQYIATANIQFQTGAAAALVTGRFNGSAYSAFQNVGGSQYCATANQWYHMTFTTRIAMAAGTNHLRLDAQSTVASAFARRGDATGTFVATGIFLVRIA